jgi:hypothetical protein
VAAFASSSERIETPVLRAMSNHESPDNTAYVELEHADACCGDGPADDAEGEATTISDVTTAHLPATVAVRLSRPERG